MYIEPISKIFERLKNRTTILSVATIAILTVLVKCVAALKEIVIAYRYGVSNELDAYLIAFMYGSFMVNILGGSFSAALVPAYIRCKQDQGFDAGKKLVSSLTGWSALLFIAAAIFLFLLAPRLLPLVGSGFDHPTIALTQKMVPILLSVVFFFGLSSIWSPIINSQNSFKLPALTPVFPSFGIIGFILICPRSWGGYALALGTAAGYFFEMAVLGIWLRRLGLTPIPNLQISKTLKDIGIQLLPLMLAAMMSTGMGVVDQSMAAMLENGSVAALNFGYRIVGIVFSLSAAIWIVALPKYSYWASDNEYANMHKSLKMQIRAIMIFSIPLVLIIIIFSRDIVALLFERGAFTVKDTKAVALIQSFYILQAPFFISSGLMMRMLSSLNQNKMLVIGGAISLVANIVLNLILIRYFKVAGIALSTSFVSILTFSYLLIVLNLKLIDMKRKSG